MRAPESLAGRIAVLVAALAMLVAAAAGAVLALRPETTAPAIDPELEEPFVPMTLRGAIIARIDGDPVTLTEAELRVAGLSSLHGDIEDVMGDEWPNAVMTSLVEDRLVRAAAEEAGIVVSKGEVAEAVARVRDLSGSAEDFDAWLAEQGITFPELERRIWMQILNGDVYRRVTADAAVSGEELREYYRDHREAYEGVDGVPLPFIAVRSSLRTELLEQRRTELFAEWLAEAGADVDVEIVDDDWWKELT
jgi:hypothetical protein